jgi:protein tyrosine phosphatase (PTP) superfamily phosphohydrolase (DUF442 family)/cytochrome c556
MHRTFQPAARTLALSLVLGLAAACGLVRTDSHAEAVRPAIALPSLAELQPVDLPGLHNVVRYADNLVSGAQPEGDEAFETLASMGVRTIISVDGSRPDVETAKRYGIRYVHLPIGYSGIDPERKAQLARAVHELPGPVYLHCHHGKHRSGGAAAAVAMALGMTDADTATARMKVSGTAANYTGLWACASETTPLSAADLAKAPAEFPSVYKTSGMVDGMVAVDVENDNVKSVEKVGWTSPEDHPDMFPAKASAGLERTLRALVDDGETMAKEAEFRELLLAAANAAKALDDAVKAGESPEALSAHFKKVGQSCKDCHTKYRD